MQQTYIPKQDYKVFVRTITYNQAKYITDTLDGVAMQQTNFPFVHFVIDDCSTDGEQEVIKAWLYEHCDMEKVEYFDLELANVIIVPHKTNANLTYAIYLLKQNLYKRIEEKVKMYQPWRDHCEYEALCEGDDYWTHPQKLQMQVVFLEENPEISYSCTRYDILMQNTEEISHASNYYFDKTENNEKSEFVFSRDDAFSKGWITKTLTCVYRTSAYDVDWTQQFKCSRDVHLVYSILSHGNGVCHNFISSVYRKNDGGIFGGLDSKGQYAIGYKVYKELYELTQDPVIATCMRKRYVENIYNGNFIFPKKFWQLLTCLRYIMHIIKQKVFCA